jgi:hypothetical protein
MWKVLQSLVVREQCKLLKIKGAEFKNKKKLNSSTLKVSTIKIGQFLQAR